MDWWIDRLVYRCTGVLCVRFDTPSPAALSVPIQHSQAICTEGVPFGHSTTSTLDCVVCQFGPVSNPGHSRSGALRLAGAPALALASLDL